jgi:hypothetical protein
MAKATIYTSPKGVALWPALRTPDTRPIKGKPVKPAYKTRLKLEGEAFEQFKTLVDPLVQEAYDKAVEEAKPQKKKLIKIKYPYVEEYDKDGNETGAWLVNFKSNAEYTKDGVTKKMSPPAVFDAKRVPIPSKVEVGNGSIVKVSFSTRPYLVDNSNEAGISLDLLAVQVFDLKVFGQRTAESYGFEEEEGFSVEEGAFEDDTEETAGESGAGEDPSDF